MTDLLFILALLALAALVYLAERRWRRSHPEFDPQDRERLGGWR